MADDKKYSDETNELINKIIKNALHYHNKCCMDPEYKTCFNKKIFLALLHGEKCEEDNSCSDYARLTVSHIKCYKNSSKFVEYIKTLNTEFSKLVNYLLSDKIENLLLINNDLIHDYIVTSYSTESKKICHELINVAKEFQIHKYYAPGMPGAVDAKNEFEKIANTEEKTKKRKYEK